MDGWARSMLHRHWEAWDPGVFHEPDEPSGRGMRALVADLGAGPRPDMDWADLIEAAVGAGPARLLRRLAHADPELRRMAAHALGWCESSALDDVYAHLPAEPDPPTRAALALAAACLTARLTADARAAAEHRLAGLLGAGDPVVRFAAALGWAQFLLPADARAPGPVLAALTGALGEGGGAYEDLWGRGWDRADHAAAGALAPVDAVSFLLRRSELPGPPADLPDLVVEEVLRAGGAAAQEDAGRLVTLIGGWAAEPGRTAAFRARAARALAKLG